MNQNKRFLYLLSLGHFLTDLNQGLLPIFLSIYKEQFSLSYTAASLVALISNLSSSVIQPLFGFWSDRRGSRWMLPAGCFLATLGMALAGWAPNYLTLILAVFLSGLGVASYHPEASKTAHYLSEEQQASSMAIFSVGGNLGFGLGPLVAAFLLAHGGTRSSPFLLFPAGLLSVYLWYSLPLLGRILANVSSSSPKPSPRYKEEGNQVLRAGNTKALLLLLAIVILRSWLHAGMTFYIPFYFINYLGGDPTFSSSLLGIFLVAGALGTLVGGHLADRWGARRLILLSMALMIPLALSLPHVRPPWLYLLVGVSGFILISSFAPSIVLAQNLLPGHVGIASGLMIGFAVGTGGLGLTILGGIADTIGVPQTLSLMSLLPILALGLGLFLPDVRRALSV
ncbi:MFS transporter, FSR family, fosmidomycin resistance protein [Thermanaeromonas toyohensis ToBE]|uniref:MFS transporter, FSR family, fosmidomycin resistance protein n=1 Tax=Thermanaeromonas toyohensis ToBE TaxID=698762 RepID=A0A1W1VYW8_9FIRM|nr:MFS transporter [Thermanaeromonas toyohensis]SMB98572.1 MFS transporter, FSR family, fosmidomycin resistance protein [Thermanaeromonas toyohensis ToBE]